MRISMTTRALHQLLDLSASRFPDKVAVEETDGASISYKELANLSDRMRDRLRHVGVKPNDRVGMCLRKSADAVALLFGIMRRVPPTWQVIRPPRRYGTHIFF